MVEGAGVDRRHHGQVREEEPQAGPPREQEPAPLPGVARRGEGQSKQREPGDQPPERRHPGKEREHCRAEPRQQLEERELLLDVIGRGHEAPGGQQVPGRGDREGCEDRQRERQERAQPAPGPERGETPEEEEQEHRRHPFGPRPADEPGEEPRLPGVAGSRLGCRLRPGAEREENHAAEQGGRERYLHPGEGRDQERRAERHREPGEQRPPPAGRAQERPDDQGGKRAGSGVEPRAEPLDRAHDTVGAAGQTEDRGDDQGPEQRGAAATRLAGVVMEPALEGHGPGVDHVDPGVVQGSRAPPRGWSP